MTDPRYPVYVISKGRADCCLTARFLLEDGCPFHIVIEPQEREEYEKHFAPELLLDLPFSDLGQGSIPARNWCWEHSKAQGAARHWIFDDNINRLKRRYKGRRIPCEAGVALYHCEEFVDRYTNIAVAGLNYEMFVPTHMVKPAFVPNVHVYSCLLIQNDLAQRWRGRYNEDTDLCLQVLSAGLCTVLFNAFIIDKVATGIMKGGNATELYRGDGRLVMARSLERVWPGVVETKRRFGRPQHVINWRKFDTPLKRRDDIDWDAIEQAAPKMRLVRKEKVKSPAVQRIKREHDLKLGIPILEGVAKHKIVQGGNVPGGHRVLWDGERKPFITPMKECNSIDLRHSDVVADIGAYVGTYAIRCARFPVKEVRAYEPTPHTFEVLNLTTLPNLEPVQAAVVGDDRDEIDLFVSRGIGVTNSTVLSRRKMGAVTVPAISYEQAVAGATVVKIDVEGAEYGFPIVQPHLRALIIDFHPVPDMDWKAAADGIIEDILAAGFTTVVEPDWSNGWTCAGSWVRPMDEPPGQCEPLMQGERCCGCGVPLIRAGCRALCPVCFESWYKRHRAGFSCAEVLASA